MCHSAKCLCKVQENNLIQGGHWWSMILTERHMNVPSQTRAANLSDKEPHAGIQHYTQSSLDIYSEWIVMKYRPIIFDYIFIISLKAGVTLARLGKTTQKRSFIVGSILPLSSSKLPLFHFSPLCSISAKSIFFFISRSAGGREASNN